MESPPTIAKRVRNSLAVAFPLPKNTFELFRRRRVWKGRGGGLLSQWSIGVVQRRGETRCPLFFKSQFAEGLFLKKQWHSPANCYCLSLAFLWCWFFSRATEPVFYTFPIFFLFDSPSLRGETVVTAHSSTLDHRPNSSILVAACLKSLVEKKLVISSYVTRLFDFRHVAHRREKRSLVSDIALQSQKKYISFPLSLSLPLPPSLSNILCLSVSVSLPL